MQLHITCLAAYNNNKTHTMTIDLDTMHTAEEINEMIQDFLKDSPMDDAEEWAIHGYENFPDMGENPDLDEIETVLGLMDEYGQEVVCGVVEYTNCADAAHSMFTDRYLGTHDSYDEYVEQYVDDCVLHEIPENLRGYFDYQRFGSDMEHDLEVIEVEGGVAIFHH